MVECRLQDAGGGEAVDDGGAALAAEIGFVGQELLGLFGGEALVPHGGGKAGGIRQVAGPVAGGLGGGAEGTVHGEWETDHETAGFLARGDAADGFRHGGELAAAEFAIGAGEAQAGIGEGEPDGAAARIDAEQTLARAQPGHEIGERHQRHRLNPTLRDRIVQPSRPAKALPMSLDPATVRRIAKLARLRVGDADVPRLQGELGAILGWIEQLNEVDIQDVAPLAGGADIPLRLREDRVTDGDRREAVLANAPGREGVFFTVPKVVE